MKILPQLAIAFALLASSSDAIAKEFKLEAFVVQLPEGWVEEQRSGETIHVFRSVDGVEQLTVSIRVLKHGLSREELAEAVREVTSVRMEAEKKVNPTTRVDGPTNGSSGVANWASYTGFESASRRKFVGYIVAERGYLGQFYLESIGTSDAHFNSLANGILNSIARDARRLGSN